MTLGSVFSRRQVVDCGQQKSDGKEEPHCARRESPPHVALVSRDSWKVACSGIQSRSRLLSTEADILSAREAAGNAICRIVIMQHTCCRRDGILPEQDEKRSEKEET